MKKWQYITVIILCVGCFIGGYFVCKYFSKPEEIIKIAEVEKPITKYTKIPVTEQEHIDCYKSPIVITGEIIDNVFKAMATDGCKETRQGFKLQASLKPFYNIMTAEYIGLINFRNALYMDHGAMINYYRLFIFTQKINFGLGGGLIIMQNNIGFKAGPILQF